MPELRIYYLCDCSGSMSGQNIAAVNTAIGRTITKLKNNNHLPPEINTRICVIRFANDAKWHLDSWLSDANWDSITDTGGLTALGNAYDLLREHLTENIQSLPLLPPIILLLSDGKPTDDADAALMRLLSARSGNKSSRYAIGIGAEADRETLLNLTGQVSGQIITTGKAPEILQAVLSFTQTGIQSVLNNT